MARPSQDHQANHEAEPIIIELDSKLVESLLTGITGGVPAALVILQWISQIRGDIGAVREKVDGFSSRLEKLELGFDLFYQKEIKLLETRIMRIENALSKREEY